MNNIQVLGIPFDFGQEHIGVRLSYSYLKERLFLNRLRRFCDIIDHHELPLPFKIKNNNEMKKSLIKNHELCSLANRDISEFIKTLDLKESFLLNIGGDHGFGLGSIHGLLHHHRDMIVVWADAHGDVNTPESSLSHNFHGMPLSFLLGLARDKHFDWMTHDLIPKDLILFGIRDLDESEKFIIQKLGIQHFSANEINRFGHRTLLESAIQKIDPYGMRPIHLSLDVDVFDPEDIPCTGTRVSEGPRREEIFAMGSFLGETGRLKSMDITEFNPLLGTEEEGERSSELILSFLENVFEALMIKHTKLRENPITYTESSLLV
jgi:arginase